MLRDLPASAPVKRADSESSADPGAGSSGIAKAAAGAALFGGGVTAGAEVRAVIAAVESADPRLGLVAAGAGLVVAGATAGAPFDAAALCALVSGSAVEA